MSACRPDDAYIVMNAVSACQHDDSDLSRRIVRKIKCPHALPPLAWHLWSRSFACYFVFSFLFNVGLLFGRTCFACSFWRNNREKKIGSAIKPDLGSFRTRSALLFNTSSNKTANEHPNFVFVGLNDSNKEAENATLPYNLCRCDEYRARHLSRLGGSSAIIYPLCVRQPNGAKI